MSEVTGAGCGCADCRDYRLWRIDGTDEWQPKADAWEVPSGSSGLVETRNVNSVDWPSTDSITADSPYSPLA